MALITGPGSQQGVIEYVGISINREECKSRELYSRGIFNKVDMHINGNFHSPLKELKTYIHAP
ncbi:hypothetical protein VAWG002_10260 [Aeromonas veronii]|nr:hypothetical protein VAWG002_10260 [Aeromonas veronii]